MLDLEVVHDAAVAAAMLDPLRARVLTTLRQPGSASTLAVALGEPRQKINYHVRTLEDLGLVELVEERPRRGLTERVMQASASSYVLSPAVLGRSEPDPDRTDRLSSGYLLAVASRLVREVADLARRASDTGKPLATMTVDTEIRFASGADRAAYTEELANAVAALAAKYHDEHATGGRWHRVIVAAHPHVGPRDVPHNGPRHAEPASPAVLAAPEPAPSRIAPIPDQEA